MSHGFLVTKHQDAWLQGKFYKFIRTYEDRFLHRITGDQKCQHKLSKTMAECGWRGIMKASLSFYNIFSNIETVDDNLCFH